MSLSSAGTFDSTSSSLLERVKAREPDAWQRLSDLYAPLVYHWCRQASLGAEDAADVVQEVFRALVTSIDRFRKEREGDSFRGWLRTITQNKLRDHARGRQRKDLPAGGTEAQRQLLQVPEAEPNSTDTHIAAGHDSGGLVARALELIRSDFHEHTWQAFWRTVIDGDPPAEVADELGLSVASVYQAKSRVLRRLREELGDLFE